MERKKLQIRNSTVEFLIFTTQAGENTIEVRVEDETVWLTQKLMAVLFEVDVRTINEHLGNIYENGEQHREATIRKFRIVQKEGNRDVARNVDFYNLDAIIAVGFRVNSARRAVPPVGDGGFARLCHSRLCAGQGAAKNGCLEKYTSHISARIEKNLFFCATQQKARTSGLSTSCHSRFPQSFRQRKVGVYAAAEG